MLFATVAKYFAMWGWLAISSISSLTAGQQSLGVCHWM
jgi:hypothetical protein